MHKSSFILRLLLLVFLSGGLWVAAQPATAQQTVTLSGRVTDAAGNAVSGAYAFLDRLPEGTSVGEQYTDGNGAYRFSVAPGRYLLRVRHQPGPLFDPRIELTLSTHTTRDIVLEAGVTLSGQVTGPAGQPVPGAWLVVYAADQAIDIGAAITTDSGHYNLGLPAGTYRINVYSEDFLNTTLEGVGVTQDTVLNIILGSGVRLEGKVVDDGGQPVSDVQVCTHLLAEQWWEGFCSETEATGSFQLRVTPEVYIVTATPLAPLQPTRLRLEVSGEGITDLVLTVNRQPMPFVPDDPPKAALISISPSTADGEITLRGAAGCVASESAVFVATLETGHFTTAQATASGSFTATLFAPAGTSVLIKADPFGTSVARFVDSDSADPDDEGLSALSGTILRVADPPGASIPISGAGLIYRDSLPAWTFRGSLNPRTLAPGNSLRVHGTVQIDSSAVQGVGALQAGTHLVLERTDRSSVLHETAGSAPTFLTPTGLPLERTGNPWATGLASGQDLTFVKTATTQAEAEVSLTLTLPSNLPAGYYRPLLLFFFPDLPKENPPSRLIVSVQQGTIHSVNLPIIKVGSPTPPRLYWALLFDTLSNGSRGVLAAEDADRFGTAQRILTPSETFVIPRLDAASGQPLPYRLEPFIPAMSLFSASGGGLPTSPLIPFRFPSGSLTVRIRHPDGTGTVLEPAPFVQSRLKSLVDAEGTLLDVGGGHLADVYQLSTMDPRFEVTFAQDGLHVITVEGTIDDIWGNTWSGGGTYEVHVGRVLALDTAVLPGTHFEVGDGFNPGLVVSPPITAEVEVRLQHIPHSDVSQLEERVIRGRTNRFGYFQPAGNTLIFEQPGEYRADITAQGEDAQGQLWMGSRTWGGVVASVNPTIVAHGRRGIDAQDTIGPQWFFFDQLPWNGEVPHAPFPFQSGDVTWVEEAGDVDSSLPILTLPRPESPAHRAAAAKRGRCRCSSRIGSLGALPSGWWSAKPPFVLQSARWGLIPTSTPAKVDLWAYSYRSVPASRSSGSGKRLAKNALPNRVLAFLMTAMPTRLG